MSLEEFIAEWNGKFVDYDENYGPQCVDLYRTYVRDVLRLPQSPPVVGAADIWDTYLTEYFERVKKASGKVPSSGNIVIWGRDYGPLGHVAICDSATDSVCKVFSQNDPVGTACGIREYSYEHVLGWLVPKDSIIDPPNNMADKIDLGGFTTKLETYGVIEIGTLKSKLLAKDENIFNSEAKIQAQNATLANEKAKLETLNRWFQEVGAEGETIGEKTASVDTMLEEKKEPHFSKSLSKLLYQLAVTLEG